MSAADLSGRWTGIFNYPRLQPPTGFTAELRDRDGLLAGETSELRYDGSMTLQAMIEGRRQGSRVTFAKFYDPLDRDYERVNYDGTVDGSGMEINGRWTIPGVWSGTFIMVRETGQAVPTEESVPVSIDADSDLSIIRSAMPSRSPAPRCSDRS